ncbi:hypothetical protein JB92DRAFT_2836129 [Gautieria morchelliformis]|nr:hypothetical protein JB92DRAFT_2836129 [Gautieria morchelliformis]
MSPPWFLADGSGGGDAGRDAKHLVMVDMDTATRTRHSTSWGNAAEATLEVETETPRRRGRGGLDGGAWRIAENPVDGEEGGRGPAGTSHDPGGENAADRAEATLARDVRRMPDWRVGGRGREEGGEQRVAGGRRKEERIIPREKIEESNPEKSCEAREESKPEKSGCQRSERKLSEGTATAESCV